jgi:hypothetical protein
VAVLVGSTALGCAGNCGAAVFVGAWLRAQRRPGLARLYARPLSASQETIRRGVSGRCVHGALVFYLKPLVLASGHGRYTTVTPERAIVSVGEWPLHITVINL